MMQSLKWLNELPDDQAVAELLKCCGSTRWARQLAAARPYANVDELLSKADQIWSSLSENDWLEAFRAHPKIGEKKAEAAQSAQARNWSSQEQSASQSTAAETKEALARGNREYEDRFGFIFIIFASGKSAEEILTSLRVRLRNDRDAEIRIAAEEQGKITQLRLSRLIELNASR